MDVYSQSDERAHGTGFVGIEADSDDAIDTLEVYEALINPRESERGSGQGGPGMMPPMMGMGGAGGAGASGAQAGLSASAGTSAASVARMSVPVMPGVAPTAGPAVASAGVGGSSGTGGGVPSLGGPAAAGLGTEPVPEPLPVPLEALEEAPEVVTEPPGLEGVVEEPGLMVETPADVMSVDPAQVEQVAREWSGLSQQMAEIGAAASELQASLEDFGLVRQPAGPYGQMATGIQQLAGGAAKEFDEIAAGLAHGAGAYRDQETEAAQIVRSAQ